MLHAKDFSFLPTKSSSTKSMYRGDGCPLCVYTDIPQVEEFLTRPEFVISMWSDPLLE